MPDFVCSLLTFISEGERNYKQFFVHTHSVKNETAILRDVFDEFEKYTCIRFVPHTDEPDYLFIRSVESRGCLSYIGHQGGRQDIFLRRPNCLYYPGTVMHETMHS